MTNVLPEWVPQARTNGITGWNRRTVIQLLVDNFMCGVSGNWSFLKYKFIYRCHSESKPNPNST